MDFSLLCNPLEIAIACNAQYNHVECYIRHLDYPYHLGRLEIHMMQFICAPQLKLSPKKESLKKEHLGININYLVSLSQEESYKMPEGLTREQRRLWAKKMLNNN